MEVSLQEAQQSSSICLGVRMPMSHSFAGYSRYNHSEKSKSRLGTTQIPKTSVRDGVPYPIRLDIPGVRIVSLVPGGMYVEM